MSSNMRAAAFESLTKDDCNELGAIRKYMDNLRDASYAGNDTAHSEIKDTPESIFRLRKHSLKADMSAEERTVLRDNVRRLASLYTLLDHDITAMIEKTDNRRWSR